MLYDSIDSDGKFSIELFSVQIKKAELVNPALNNSNCNLDCEMDSGTK